MQYNYPRGEEHGYPFTTAFTSSVRTPKKDYPIVTDMNPLTGLGLGSGLAGVSGE